MRPTPPFSALALLTAAALPGSVALAQMVYKSTSAADEVLYSETPAPDARTVEPIALPAGPTPAQVDQARRAGDSIKQLADGMEAERLARESAARARRQAAAESKELASQQALAEKMKQEQFTMREYYGYRDYTFPPIPEPKPKPTVAPAAQRLPVPVVTPLAVP